MRAPSLPLAERIMTAVLLPPPAPYPEGLFRGVLRSPLPAPFGAAHSVRDAAVDGDLLELELLGELLVELLQLVDEVLAGLHDGLLGRDGAVGLDAQLEHREQRMRHLVGGEDDVRRLDELRPQQVAQRVVLLVEREHGRVGHAWRGGSENARREGGIYRPMGDRDRWAATHGSHSQRSPCSRPRRAGTPRACPDARRQKCAFSKARRSSQARSRVLAQAVLRSVFSWRMDGWRWRTYRSGALDMAAGGLECHDTLERRTGEEELRFLRSSPTLSESRET
nr:hypothetical protein CFP56_04194 [Quercus suber]